MITDKLKELAAARAKLEAMEQKLASSLKSELAGLPSRYGFSSTAEFVTAVKKAAGGRRGRPRKSAAMASIGGGRRKRRAVVTDEMRKHVKKMVGEGKTGAEIAKAVGVSLPTVQNIKKALGLVQKRKK